MLGTANWDFQNRIREAVRLLRHQLVTGCLESRELSLALTKLEEAEMWALRAGPAKPKEKAP